MESGKPPKPPERHSTAYRQLVELPAQLCKALKSTQSSDRNIVVADVNNKVYHLWMNRNELETVLQSTGTRSFFNSLNCLSADGVWSIEQGSGDPIRASVAWLTSLILAVLAHQMLLLSKSTPEIEIYKTCKLPLPLSSLAAFCKSLILPYQTQRAILSEIYEYLSEQQGTGPSMFSENRGGFLQRCGEELSQCQTWIVETDSKMKQDIQEKEKEMEGLKKVHAKYIQEAHPPCTCKKKMTYCGPYKSQRAADNMTIPVYKRILPDEDHSRQLVAAYACSSMELRAVSDIWARLVGDAFVCRDFTSALMWTAFLSERLPSTWSNKFNASACFAGSNTKGRATHCSLSSDINLAQINKPCELDFRMTYRGASGDVAIAFAGSVTDAFRASCTFQLPSPYEDLQYSLDTTTQCTELCDRKTV